MLEVKNLSFSYDQQPVFVDFCLKVKKGELTLLNGENGSGKTTLLKCIAGVLNGGKNIYIDGLELISNRNKTKHISYIMSEDTLYEYLTINENLNFFCELFHENEEFLVKANTFISLFMLDDYKDYLIKNLSKGMRQKVYLSIMLSKSAEIFILDEPFSSLDFLTQQKIKKILIDLALSDKCVLYSSHIEEFKELANKEIKLQNKEEI